MIDKLQNFMKWASEQVFKTNPPKEQHMDHMSKLPSGANITVTTPTAAETIVSAGTSTPATVTKTKRKYTRRKSNVTH
jgi:hypothetical protein